MTNIIIFGVLLPLVFSLYVWAAYMHNTCIQNGLDKQFFKSIKKSFYLSICSALISLAAIYAVYYNQITKNGEILASSFTIAISAGLSSLLIRNMLVYFHNRHPEIFEKTFQLDKVNKVVQHGINAGYAAVLGIIMIIVISLIDNIAIK